MQNEQDQSIFRIKVGDFWLNFIPFANNKRKLSKSAPSPFNSHLYAVTRKDQDWLNPPFKAK